MLRYGALAILALAGLAAIYPRPLAWTYVIAFMVFEFWLLRRMGSAGEGPPPVEEPPYRFDADEAQLIGRYRYYFTYPAIARDAASVLSAIGLSALVLSPWLVYRQELLAAMLVGVNLLAVASLTKRLSPVMVLRIAANKGDRASLRLLEAHDSAWAKIKEGNAAQA